jgi:hypothetical protein
MVPETRCGAALPSRGPLEYTLLDIEYSDKMGDNQKARGDPAKYFQLCASEERQR